MIRRLLRRKDNEADLAAPLALTGAEGEAWMEFPGQVVDAVQQAITRIMRTDPFPEKLAVMSAVREEGVTYLSRAIGAVLAKDLGRKICVVELNWWWPADYPSVVNGRPGLAEVLQEEAELEPVFIPTGMDNLTLIPAGKLAKNLRATLAYSDALSTAMNTLSERFDHIILDLPAVTAASESIRLASHSKAVCVVVNQGVTPVQRVKATLDDLDHLNILGVIMNQVNVATPSFILDYIVQE